MFSRILVPLETSPRSRKRRREWQRRSRAPRRLRLASSSHTKCLRTMGVLAAKRSDAKTPEETLYVRSLAEKLEKNASVTVDGWWRSANPSMSSVAARARSMLTDCHDVARPHGAQPHVVRQCGRRRRARSVRSGANVAASRRKARRTRRHPALPSNPVALDGSATSSAILDAAGDMARASSGTLILARVITPVPLFASNEGRPVYPTAIVDEDATQQARERRPRRAGRTRTLIRRWTEDRDRRCDWRDRSATEILELAKEKGADLIAITTRGRGASRLVVGSVADKICARRICRCWFFIRTRPREAQTFPLASDSLRNF